MIFLGLFLGILVTCYLPGFIFFNRFQISLPLFTKTLLCILLSMLLMFQVSFIATISGFLSLYWIYFFTIILISIYILKEIKIELTLASLNAGLRKNIHDSLSLLLVLALLMFFLSNLNRLDAVFTTWDGMFSWGRWANDWYNGILPQGTYHYPQLIPAAWAAIYRFCGKNYQFFIIFLVPTIVFIFLFSIIELFQKFKGLGLLFFILIFSWINQFYTWFVFDGCVDVVVIATTGISLICLKYALVAKEKNELALINKWIICSVLMASAAALTKQAGLITALYIFIEFYFYNRNLPRDKKILLKTFFIFAVLVLPWYLWIEYQIKIGHNGSEISYVTNEIYKGKGLLDRFLNAKRLVGLNLYFFLFNFIWLFLFTGLKRRLAILNLFLFFLWALFFSYDIRNLSVGFVVCAFSYGVFFEDQWLSKTKTLIEKIRVLELKKYSLLFLIIPIFILIFIAHEIYPKEKLEFHSRKLKIKAYINPDAANFLYLGWNQKCSSVSTDLQPLALLPDFENKFKHLDTTDNSLKKQAAFRERLSDQSIPCYMISKKIFDDLELILQDIVHSEDLLLVENAGEFRFYERKSSLSH